MSKRKRVHPRGLGTILNFSMRWSVEENMYTNCNLNLKISNVVSGVISMQYIRIFERGVKQTSIYEEKLI